MNIGDKYKGKKVLIVGLGKSGIVALELMHSFGADIAVFDAKDLEQATPQVRSLLRAAHAQVFSDGALPPAEGWDFIVVSPGVPLELPFIAAVTGSGATLTGDLELAYELGKGIFIAITGTNGKTTTTALVGEIFQNAGIDSAVTGNIGEPVILAARAANENRVLVTEVSSFQLEPTRRFRPKVSAILNLTPDHLDRHGTMEHYGAIKAKIFENQDADDFFVYNLDDPAVCRLAEGCKATRIPFSGTRILGCGAFVRDGRIVLADGNGREYELIETADLGIPGAHNLENALAAAAIAFWGGVNPDAIAQTLTSFQGVAHRMEPVDVIDGVRFVNDSKGTNPDASMKAIDAVEPNIVLIAGGYDKQADFRPFVRKLQNKASHLLLLGQTAETIRRVAEEEGFVNAAVCRDMEECVNRGFELARPGDTVLLSPACASWDMYGCFEERGEHFKQIVATLRNGAESAEDERTVRNR